MSSAITTDRAVTEVATPRSGGQVGVHPIDEACRHHVSPLYWDWRRLYAADPAACPLQHPDVVLTELAYETASKLTPLLLRQEVDGNCCGVGALLPKTVTTKRLGAWPLGWTLQGYRLPGHGFLVESTANLTEMFQASLSAVEQSRGEFLLIEDLDDETPLAAVIEENLPAGWSVYRHAGTQPRRRIQLPADSASYWEKFSSKTRQTFRRKLKKFGETRLQRVTDIDDVPDFLQAAHQISLQTWQTRQFGLRVRNDAAELALFTRLAELNLLRCYLWMVADQPVAFTIGNQDHDCFHYEEVGYLADFAKWSPGQMMLIQMIDDLIAWQRPEWFDFGGGDADYKELFATHSSRSGTVWILPPTVSGRIAAQHLHWSQRLRSTVRQQADRWGWTTRLRQWVRYGSGKGRSES